MRDGVCMGGSPVTPRLWEVPQEPTMQARVPPGASQASRGAE